jgi:hypothetical protein
VIGVNVADVLPIVTDPVVFGPNVIWVGTTFAKLALVKATAKATSEMLKISLRVIYCCPPLNLVGRVRPSCLQIFRYSCYST